MPSTVISKVCSADHWWSARIAEVVLESLFQSIFCALRTTKLFKVVRAPEKFGNLWPSNFVLQLQSHASGVVAAPLGIDHFAGTLHLVVQNRRAVLRR